MWIGVELATVDDGQVSTLLEVFLDLLGARANEHLFHEQGVIGPGADDSDLDLIKRVPTAPTVNDEEVGSTVEVVDGPLSVDFVSFRTDGDVSRSPPYRILGVLVFNHPLFLGNPAGTLSTISNQSSRRRDSIWPHHWIGVVLDHWLHSKFIQFCHCWVSHDARVGDALVPESLVRLTMPSTS